MAEWDPGRRGARGRRGRVVPVALVIALAGPARAGWRDVLPPAPPLGRALFVLDATSFTPAERLLAATLQGQVNREAATLYLVHDRYDRRWLARYVEGRTIPRPSPLEDLRAALERFRGRIAGAVVPDPALPATINAATALASVRGGIVVDPSLLPRFPRLPVLEDLRGRWRRGLDVQRWAWRSLRSRLSPKALASYHPTACGHRLRDYLTAHRIFPFWVPRAAGAEAFREAKAWLEEVLAATPPTIPVLGFWWTPRDPGLEEYGGVRLAGRYGKFTVVTDWAGNLSFHGSVPGPARWKDLLARPADAAGRGPRDPPRHALAFLVVESGDAPCYWIQRQSDVWLDPARGRIPIGWSLSPLVAALMPGILKWYAEAATPRDRFLCALSGIGYIFPFLGYGDRTPDPAATRRAFLRLTREATEELGLREAILYTDAWRRFDRVAAMPLLEEWARELPGLDAVVLGMGRDEGIDARTACFLVPRDRGRPLAALHVLTRWEAERPRGAGTEHDVAWLTREIRTIAPPEPPSLLPVMALSWVHAPSTIRAVLDRLGPSFEAVPIEAIGAALRSRGS